MSDLLSPNQVVSQLLQLGRDLDQETRDLEKVEEEAVYAIEAYRTAKDMAFLKAEGTQYIREAQSRLDTHVERIASELAEAKVRNTRARIAAIKARVDIGRSAAAALRAEISLGGVH